MPTEEKLQVRVRSRGFVDSAGIKQLMVERKTVSAADFSGQTLDHFVSVGSTFKSCRFEGMRIEYACFGSGRKTSHYEDCSFDGTTIVASTPGYAKFVKCRFLNISITEFFGFNVSMVDCVFSGKLRKIVFYGADPTRRAWLWKKRNKFAGNDFSHARFSDVAFREHIDLSKQRLPNGWAPGGDPYQNVT